MHRTFIFGRRGQVATARRPSPASGTPMALSLRKPLFAVTALSLALGIAACDTAQTAGTPAAVTPIVSGTSPFDGQPIRTLRAADLADYTHDVRSAVAARGLDAAEVTAGSDMVPLADALAGEARGGTALSTHVVIADGGVAQQYVLNVDRADLVARRGDDDRYVMLDPDVFSPDPTDGLATSRDVPVTNLDTGEDATATISSEGTKVDGEDVDVIVVDAVAVYDPTQEENPASGVFGAARPDRTELGTPDAQGQIAAVVLGLRSLRINQNHDSGGTFDTKQEVQFTIQQGDDYSVQFSHFNTARFDAQEVVRTLTSPPAPVYGTTTFQPVSSSIIGGVLHQLWFKAADVNYANIDYDFRNGRYYDCASYLGTGGQCTEYAAPGDFPLQFFTTGNVSYRAYMNEDDYATTYFSTRSGSWQGNVATANFGTGSVQTLLTRVYGGNHTALSSDQVFTSSGLRQITANALFTNTNSGSTTSRLNVNGLRWEFSRMTLNT